MIAQLGLSSSADLHDWVSSVLSLLGCPPLASTFPSPSSSSAASFPSAPRHASGRAHPLARVKRKALVVGLSLAPVVPPEDALPTPGVRKCGICRLPGHRVQTCPMAKAQRSGGVGDGDGNARKRGREASDAVLSDSDGEAFEGVDV